MIINKVSILPDGRLAIFPSKASSSYQYVYREACEVYWDNDNQYFYSPVPREWNYKNWYVHIVSVVRTGLSIRLNLSGNTVFEANEDNFKSDMIDANEDVQKWMSEQDIGQPKNEQNEIGAEKEELNRISDEASKAFHSKKFNQVIKLLTPYENSPYFSEKAIALLKMAKKYA